MIDYADQILDLKPPEPIWMESGNEDGMDVEDHEEDSENRLEDMVQFVASLLYDDKPLSKPVGYDDFEDSDSNDDAGGGEGRSRRRRRGTNLAGFRVPT